MNASDKDDLNIIFNDGHFVDMQIVWQTWAMKYCDNGGETLSPTRPPANPLTQPAVRVAIGCNRRRVISAKTSENGADWSSDFGLHTPDAAMDPPELQFYRIRPFYIGERSLLPFPNSPSPSRPASLFFSIS